MPVPPADGGLRVLAPRAALIVWLCRLTCGIVASCDLLITGLEPMAAAAILAAA